jgi:hypothetical protein
MTGILYVIYVTALDEWAKNPTEYLPSKAISVFTAEQKPWDEVT